MTLLTIKRNTWCRLFHRRRRSTFTGGWVRQTCSACRDQEERRP